MTDRAAARTNLLAAVRLVTDALALKFSPGQSLEDIESEYNTRLYGAMDDYLNSEKPITAFRNEFRRVVSDGFNLTAIAGWADAGASGPISDELQAWINDRIDREVAYVDELFNALRDLRRTTESMDERANFIQQRADGYTGTLQGIYNYAEMTAQKDRPGRWEYGDTDHCDTCAGLNDQTHPLSWYTDNGYIPQQQGSDTLECGGWHCQCRIVDPKTGEQLIP